MISGWIAPGPGQMGLRDAVLTGSAIRFAVVDEQGKLLSFSGRVDGGKINGSVTTEDGKRDNFSAMKINK